MKEGLAAGLAAATTENGQLHAVLRTNEGLAARAANAEAAASRLPVLTASNAALTMRAESLQADNQRLQVRMSLVTLAQRMRSLVEFRSTWHTVTHCGCWP